MKKSFILLIVILSANLSFGQKVYTDKTEYEKALTQYYDELDSYENYVKKIDFYKNFVFPKRRSYPQNRSEWMNYFGDLLSKSNIRFDNHEVRLHSNVKPSGIVYINFLESNTSSNLIISISEQSHPDAIYTASTYRFNHPGVKPTYKRPTQTKRDRVVNSSIVIKNTTPKIDTPIIKTSIIKPDGYYKEEFIENNRVILKVTVIKNGVTRVYKKINYSWGGEFFFKDDSSISHNLFTCSTNNHN